MRTCYGWWLALVPAVVLALGSSLQAADPIPTTISIPDLECQGCAKKVAARLYEVSGVGAVQANVQEKTATITPQAQANVSPRALWEAVEKAGKHPARLDGPRGTFTAKPQF